MFACSECVGANQTGPTLMKLTTICDVSHVISYTRPSSPLFFSGGIERKAWERGYTTLTSSYQSQLLASYSLVVLQPPLQRYDSSTGQVSARDILLVTWALTTLLLLFHLQYSSFAFFSHGFQHCLHYYTVDIQWLLSGPDSEGSDGGDQPHLLTSNLGQCPTPRGV